VLPADLIGWARRFTLLKAYERTPMTSPTTTSATPTISNGVPIQNQLDCIIDDLLRSLPNAPDLSAEQRRGIIARYAAVLEGNFIYWMSGALLSARSEDARAIILENLHEEVRDSHPNMMRKFALAAHAWPTEADSLEVYRDLTKVRLFIGRLSEVKILITMAFFEGFIQRFMGYLADLAKRQGSMEMEYTDIHGICDVVHTQELFRAVAAEMTLNPPQPGTDLLEGVYLLRDLIRTIVHSKSLECLGA
jgi:hypothetical protein